MADISITLKMLTEATTSEMPPTASRNVLIVAICWLNRSISCSASLTW